MEHPTLMKAEAERLPCGKLLQKHEENEWIPVRKRI